MELQVQPFRCSLDDGTVGMAALWPPSGTQLFRPWRADGAKSNIHGREPPWADKGPFAGIHLFEDQEEAGLRVIRALSKKQQDKAIIYPSILSKDLPPERKHSDDGRHWGGAFQDNRVISYEGISGTDLTAEQRKLVLELVDVHVSTLPQGPRKSRVDEVARHLAETHFAWIRGIRRQKRLLLQGA